MGQSGNIELSITIEEHIRVMPDKQARSYI